MERDLNGNYVYGRTWDFNSHAHVERDVYQFQWQEQTVHFNSHAHVERDFQFILSAKIITYFNSHAHVERDKFLMSGKIWQNLFQLTRSRGAWLHFLFTSLSIILFQLTRSRGAWHTNFLGVLRYKGKFQLTRSRGAWRHICVKRFGRTKISTHTLTWSVTFVVTSNIISIFSFQLTRSRGAWLLL